MDGGWGLGDGGWGTTLTPTLSQRERENEGFAQGVREAKVLGYVRQTPGDMVYWLFEGSAPRNLVKVISECRVPVPGGEAVLAIIGSSHFLEIGIGGAVLTEMLASVRPGLDGLLTARGLRNGRGGTQLVRDGLDYRFRLEEIHYNPVDFARETERLVREDPHRLCCRFPAGNGEASAVTCLDWQIGPQVLNLDTYHTFPGESTIVRSRTVVGFSERGGTP